MLKFIFDVLSAIACVVWIGVMVFLFVTGVAFKIVYAILLGGLIFILFCKMFEAIDNARDDAENFSEKDSSER